MRWALACTHDRSRRLALAFRALQARVARRRRLSQCSQVVAVRAAQTRLQETWTAWLLAKDYAGRVRRMRTVSCRGVLRWWWALALAGRHRRVGLLCASFAAWRDEASERRCARIVAAFSQQRRPARLRDTLKAWLAVANR